MSKWSALPCLSLLSVAILAPPPAAAAPRPLDRFFGDRNNLLTERVEIEGIVLPLREQPPQPVEVAQAAGLLPPAAIGQTPIVCLLDFQSETLSSDEQEALSQAVWARLRQLAGLRLLPREDTHRWLISHDLHPLMPYGDRVPLNEVAAALRADYLVTGHVDQVQGIYTIDYSVFSARTGAPLVQDARHQRATIDEMVSYFGGLANEMRQVIVKDATGVEVASVTAFHAPPPEEVAAAPAQAVPVDHKQAPASSGKTRLRGGEVVLEAPEHPAPAPARRAEPPAPADPRPMEPLATEIVEPATEPAPAPAERSEPPAPADEAPQMDEEIPPAPETAATPAVESTPAAAEPEPEPEVQAVEEPTAPVRPAAEKDASADPARAEQLYEEALALSGDDQAEQRLEKIRQAAELDPTNPTYHQILANEYHRAGQFQKVIEHCDKALALAPNDSMVLTIKASALFSLGRFQEAAAINKAAIEAKPDNLYARYNYALTLDELDSTDELAAWREYLQHAADDPTHNRLKLVDHARERVRQLEP
ncbi:MAG: Tetratricopeptide repeat protein [candidate division BRC1 bacterium ADurb.BinA292]|nr:MAG: Tetratricopeptide repeat protein [candidate division BRC1 bacterium ADurb.BinA292]